MATPDIPTYRGVPETIGANGRSNYVVPQSRNATLSVPTVPSVLGGTHSDEFRVLTGVLTRVSPDEAAEDTSLATAEAMHLASELESARAELEVLQSRQQSAIDAASSNSAAMFILSKVVEAGTLDLDTLDANLTAPDGWVAFALLWRASLVECFGQVILPTDLGIELLNWLESASSSAYSLTASE